MTAVELFTESIINIINDAQDNDLNIEFIRNKISIDFKDEFIEMEKQQIIDAVDYCFASLKLSDDKTMFIAITAEQYYNKKFKNTEK